MVNINARKDERLLSVVLSAGCRPLLRPLLDTLCRSAHHSNGNDMYRNPGLVTFPFDQSININAFIILDYLSFFSRIGDKNSPPPPLLLGD